MPARLALTHRENVFIEAWLALRGNGVEAARRAGYRGSNKALSVTACRVLVRARVQKALAARLAAAAAQLVGGGPTPEEIIAVLTAHLRGNMGDAIRIDPDNGEPTIDLRRLEQKGLLHIVRKVARHEARSSSETCTSESKTVSIELYSALDAAAILGRFFGMDRSRPEPPAPIVDARKLIAAILESSRYISAPRLLQDQRLGDGVTTALPP